MTHSPLSPDDLDDLAVLEQAVTDADGIRLKLEWPYLKEGRLTAAVTHREAGRLIGFLGLYAFGGPPEVELVGMVDPGHRRAGVGGRLLAEALAISEQEGLTRRLIVVPRGSPAAIAFAIASGAVLEHSEHALVLTGKAQRIPEDPAVTLRDAGDGDLPHLIRILTAGFGPPPAGMLDRLHDARSRTLMIDHAERPVGTLRVSLDEVEGGIFGFAIDPEYRGRGIGRDVLGRTCADLLTRGAPHVRLEVAVENDAALHLYTSTGFTPRGTEDYYLLPD